jgi:hypothetical protein
MQEIINKLKAAIKICDDPLLLDLLKSILAEAKNLQNDN